MANYLDGTETPAPEPPQFCPFCKGRLECRWRGQINHRVRRGHFAIAVPFFVCFDCEITVRVMPSPVRTRSSKRRGALRTTRSAAIKDLEPEIKRLNDPQRRKALLAGWRA